MLLYFGIALGVLALLCFGLAVAADMKSDALNDAERFAQWLDHSQTLDPSKAGFFDSVRAQHNLRPFRPYDFGKEEQK